MACAGSRSRLLKTAITIASLCVGLIVAEVLLRLFIPFNYLKPPQLLPRDVWRELVNQRSEIPGLDYELRANVEKLAQDAMVRTNSHGMRDRERSMEKRAGVFRIAVVGDSFTFGFGVENEAAYPSVLERLLNDSGSNDKYEVLNFGVGGYSTRDEALVVRHRIMQWNPDLIIIGYVSNDPETDPIQAPHAYFHKPAWWQHSHVLRLIARAKNVFDINYYGGGNYVKYLHHYPLKWQTVVDGFRDMRQVASARNIKVVVAIFPLRTETYEKVRAAAADAGLIPVGMNEGFSAHARNETSLPDGHPNNLGHRIAAQTIRDALMSYQLLPKN
jgi:lysophospholipase L1-like esterase